MAGRGLIRARDVNKGSGKREDLSLVLELLQEEYYLVFEVIIISSGNLCAIRSRLKDIGVVKLRNFSGEARLHVEFLYTIQLFDQ